MNFENRLLFNDLNNVGLLSLQGDISPEDSVRLSKIRRAWNFYDGFHWEELPQSDKPEITENYCRAYVNKFVATEFGKGFYITYPDDIEGEVDVVKGNIVNEGELKNDEFDITEYLEDVWRENNKFRFCLELGQSKSITGDGWIHTRYYPNGTFDDPFNEYEKGKVKIIVVPTGIAFPEYDPHDKDKLVRFTMAYPIEVEKESFISRKSRVKKVIYKAVWTKDTVEEWIGTELKRRFKNKYEVIPFVQIKNFPVVGRQEGVGDLDDIIPLNVELNTKLSDVSEILDYHSAPITLVFGAKVSNLEKGANKVWGGLPKDGKVQNLELQGDLSASMGYISDLKGTMNEIGAIPEGSLGGKMAISNTSGVALSYANLPLIERIRVKRAMSREGIEKVNKLILLISLKEGLIKKPENMSYRDFYNNEVIFPDTLPKDELMELNKIESEFRLAIENREGAMKRLGRQNIQAKLQEVDEERKRHPEVFGLNPEGINNASRIQVNKEGDTKTINSGEMNSPY